MSDADWRSARLGVTPSLILQIQSLLPRIFSLLRCLGNLQTKALYSRGLFGSDFRKSGCFQEIPCNFPC